MKNNFKSLLIALTCFTSVETSAQFSTLYAGMWHPESVISDGKFLYVTDIGRELNPLAKDSDGAIRKFSLDGNLIEANLSKEPLNAPKGTAIIKNVLYVADLERIVGIDIASGNKISTIDFSSFGVHLINDIAVKNDTVLFASSTDLNKIFQISLGKSQRIIELNIPEIKGANGVCYDTKNNRLYIVGLGSFNSAKGEGEIGYIDWKKNKPEYFKFPNITGFFDGIELVAANNIIVSDWVNLAKAEGVLKKINVNTGVVTTLTNEPLGGPADFYFDSKINQLIIPATQQGRLLRLSLSGAQPNLSRYEIGFKKYEQIKKENADKHLQFLTEISPALAKQIIENAYGEVYTDIKLDMKTIEIAVIAALTAKGNAEPQLKVHINEALNFGCTTQDIKDLFQLMTLYCGIPNAINGLTILKDVEKERSIKK